jgi:hypothetical protein
VWEKRLTLAYPLDTGCRYRQEMGGLRTLVASIREQHESVDHSATVGPIK